MPLSIDIDRALIVQLYVRGRIEIPAPTATQLPIPPATQQWLLTHGLPLLDGELLGVVFQPPRAVTTKLRPRDKTETTLTDIGHEIWLAGEKLRIGVLADSGEVVMYGPEADFCRANASLEAFVQFLALYQPASEILNADVPPLRIYTAEEMQLRVEAMRRGEIKPPKPTKPTVNRSKLFRELKQQMQAIDAEAFKRNRWWQRVMAELKDGLI